MEKPSVPRLFTGPDRPRRQLSGKVVAEGKDLASNSLCVAERVAAGPCAGAIGASETEHSGRPFNWAFMMRFSAARYSFRASNSWSTVPVT